VWTLKHIQML